MPGAVQKSCVELKKVQVRYKENVYRRITRRNANIGEFHYFLMYIQDVNSNENLGVHTDGPFEVLSRMRRTFFIRRGKVV